MVRNVNLGKDVVVLKGVKCLTCVTASRENNHIVRIPKNASKGCDVDDVVHLGTNEPV